MVGVAGSNPVVSTSIQHTFLIRDAEECRELAPALEFILAEALGFLRRHDVCFKSSFGCFFIFYDRKKS